MKVRLSMSIKDVKRQYITGIATGLFLSGSIAEVTVKQVAEAAEIGEATAYRYFTDKKGIVLACALSLQNQVYERFYKLTGHTGYEKLCRFYDGYLRVMRVHPEYYRFLGDFDVYMRGCGESLTAYSDGLDLFRREFEDAYNEGIRDGSVRAIPDFDFFYYATTHALLGLCKKLAVNESLVRQDQIVEKENEVNKLIEVILFYIRQ